MRKIIIFTLTAVLFLSSCKKETTLSFNDEEIIIDLGGSEEDILKYVSASDNSKISVSGINYDKVGLQHGLFSANGTQVQHDVKIRADKLTGTYQFHLFFRSGEKDVERTIGNWLVELTSGNKYNQIRFPCKNTKGTDIILNKNYLEISLDNDSAYIPPTEGQLNFFVSTKITPLEFQDIEYGKTDNHTYSLKGFTIRRFHDEYIDTLLVRLYKK